VGFRRTQDQGPTECFIWEAARVEDQLAVGLAWSLGIKEHPLWLGHGAGPYGRRLTLRKRRSEDQETRPVMPEEEGGERKRSGKGGVESVAAMIPFPISRGDGPDQTSSPPLSPDSTSPTLQP
jgi:hypothetical protein